MTDRVDKGNLYDRLNVITQQTKALVENMEILQEHMNSVLKENAELTIENNHLREMMAQQNFKADEGLSDSRKNLQKLYQEGFHVCNEYYGKRLEDDESCTFCLDVIFNDQRGKG